MSVKYKISRGNSLNLGATIEADGVNFAIWCRYAKVMELLLFKDVNDANPEVIELSGWEHRSTYYWHVLVHGIKDGQIYGWRVKELLVKSPGFIFDPQKVLLDPYGRRIIFPDNYNRTFSRYVGSNTIFCAKNVVVDMHKYDWEEDLSPHHPLSSNVIYEMHVAGFTKDPSSKLPEKIRGTYLGVIEKINYLVELGINAVELLPVFQYDKYDALPGKMNYWGYCPMGFFAIHGDYASNKDVYGPINEFRDMVKAFHKAGIEVFLDVVYNHTSEGDTAGPVYCYKGLDNEAYYILDENQGYKNFSGCGNTLNASHPMVKRLINDSLHFWAEEMHIDGFRFDLACILSRSTNGEPLNDPPTTLAIDSDYKLSDVKLIAEPWDAGGLYQVGRMAGAKWREWNGQFRDDMRCFLKGDNNMIHKFVNRLLGSPDIYNTHAADPQKSINFVSCHDGYTLWDMLCYEQKHNMDNGEGNRDGNNANFSSNYGVEGESTNPELNALRLRQAKNFMLLNLFSMGTPMILMGDEVLRTQKGNNNAYCQDNKLSYLNWQHTKMQEEMFNFTSSLLSYRVSRGKLTFSAVYSLADAIKKNQIIWHGVQPNMPDWSDSSHSIGLTVYSDSHNAYYYMFVNAYWGGLHIKLPDVPLKGDERWMRIVDTSLPPPEDIHATAKPLPKIGHNYYLEGRSILVLVAPCDR
jgi:isoamylase